MTGNVSAESSSSPGEPLDPQRVSAAGQIYQAMVSDLLKCEFDRRRALEGRGATLVTSSGALLTLIFGLTVLVTGKDQVFQNRWAIWVLLAALVAFVASALIAIFIQSWGFKYAITSRKTLKSLARDNTEWARLADDATRSWLTRQVNTICSLRDGNDMKAKLVTWSLGFQVAAITLLSASVGIDLSGRV
ncbi:hypothetical protein MHEI_37150 [Mycobacterium heidelbergense]|nr:hypothetical protein MHEI_37150 [Mycobacterium heidelbergense]